MAINTTFSVAMIKVTGSLQKSTEIMKQSNALIKLPQLTATMREMSMEMTKVSVVVLLSYRTISTPSPHRLV